MLRKLFASEAHHSVARHVSPAELERALACLCLEPPRAVWAALVTTDGLLRACFPPLSAGQRDRITAMSAAMLSLGERISCELATGALGYTLIAGADGATLLIALDDGHLLALGLPPANSLDAVFEGVRLSAVPLLQQLGMASLAI